MMSVVSRVLLVRRLRKRAGLGALTLCLVTASFAAWQFGNGFLHRNAESPDSSNGALTLHHLGWSTIDIAKPATHGSVSILFNLPPDASQGPSRWYLLRLQVEVAAVGPRRIHSLTSRDPPMV